MPSRAHRRMRRHQMHHHQQRRQQRQVTSQLSRLGGAALTQPIFLITSDKLEVTVSRSMPTVLLGRMDDASWNSFCDKVDDALSPISRMNQAMKKCCFYPLAVFIPAILVGLVATAVVMNLPNDTNGSELLKNLLPLVFLVACVASLAWAFGMVKYSSICKRKVNEKLARVCYDTSTSYPGISFQVYFEMNYAQVIVSNIDNADAIEKHDAASHSTSSSTSGTNSSDPMSLSPASTPTLSTSFIEGAKKWKSAVDEKTNKVYYFNEETKEVTWTHPFASGEADKKMEDQFDETSSTANIVSTDLHIDV
mmetsp:Transcript_11885/g.20644  ORF Transcript_11885/g.20644 Transcript_11885/m.20644 type:complete len:308 (+) Transcript_11885:81-1004(+)